MSLNLNLNVYVICKASYKQMCSRHLKYKLRPSHHIRCVVQLDSCQTCISRSSLDTFAEVKIIVKNMFHSPFHQNWISLWDEKLVHMDIGSYRFQFSDIGHIRVFSRIRNIGVFHKDPICSFHFRLKAVLAWAPSKLGLKEEGEFHFVP